MPTYYYGWNSKTDWGVEAEASYGTAVTPTERFSWLRSATVNVTENVSREYFLNSSKYRKADAAIKGRHEVTGTLTFWLPNDLDNSMLDAWFLKMPLDAYNVAHSGTSSIWVIPNTGTSAYGSNVLPAFTLEIGHDTPAGDNIRKHKIRGCVVDGFTMRARTGERIECSADFIGQYDEIASSAFTAGLSRSTGHPLGWENITLAYADEGSTTTVTDFTAFEFTIANNLTPNYDLSSITIQRGLTNMIAGRQEISGSATLNVTTTTGWTLYSDLLNDATWEYTPQSGVKNKEWVFTIQNNDWPSTAAIKYMFHNVVIGEIPLDIDPTKIQEITIPWTAEYYALQLISTDATAPTNWDDQS